MLVNHVSAYIVANVVPGIQGNAHSSIAPYETLRARDVEIVIAVGNDRQFVETITALPEFLSNGARVKNREALHLELEARLSLMPVAHWLSLFASAGVPSGKVNSIDEAFEYAHQLGLVATYSRLENGTNAERQVVNPISFSETPAEYWWHPPVWADMTTT